MRNAAFFSTLILTGALCVFSPLLALVCGSLLFAAIFLGGDDDDLKPA